MAIHYIGAIPNAANEKAKYLAAGLAGAGESVANVMNTITAAKLKQEGNLAVAQKRVDAYVESRKNQIDYQNAQKRRALAEKMYQNASNMQADDPQKWNMFKSTEAYKHASKFIDKELSTDDFSVLDAKGDLVALPPTRKMDSLADMFGAKIKEQMGVDNTNPWADGLSGVTGNTDDPMGILGQ